MLKKHPYILTTIITVLICTVVWQLMPKQYAAQTKIVDEYKEVDLAVGLDNMTAAVKDAMGKGNEGINDIEVYCKALKTEDFARRLSHCTIAQQGITYGAHLADKDTVEAVLDNLNYNLSTKQQAITIEVKDRDPLVAAQMLDSTVALLQTMVTTHRHEAVEAALQNALKEQRKAEKQYQEALAANATYADTHQDASLEEVKNEQQRLSDDFDQAFKRYRKATLEVERQQYLSKRTYTSFAVSKVNSVPLEDNSHPVGFTLLAVVLALLAVKGIRLFLKRRKDKGFAHDFGDPTSPWSITLAVWGGLMFAMIFRDPSLLNAPTSQFYISLGLWLVFFCVTAFLTYSLLESGKSLSTASAHPSITLSHANKVVFHTLLCLSVVLTPLYVKKVLDVVMMFGTEDLTSNIRRLAIYGNEQSFLNYSTVINEALLLVAVCTYPHIKRWKVIMACTACCLNSLAIMEKGGLLLIIFAVVYMLYQRGIIKIRSIIILVVAVLLLAWGFNLMREEDDAEATSENSLLGFIAMYLLSPPVAYSTLMQELVPQFGGHTFPLAYLFMNKMGIGNYVFFDRLQDFVFVPISTNVYTIFQPFYMDFGQPGIAVFAVFYGVIMGWTYRKLRDGNPFAKCLYIYFAYTLVLQFFQEYIFTGNLHIIQLVVLIYLCTQKDFCFSPAKSIRT